MIPEESSALQGALVWFRRDLRDYDHAALHAALEAHHAVHCAFVFDTEILDALGSNADRRVTFIWESVRELKAALEARGGGLRVLPGWVAATGVRCGNPPRQHPQPCAWSAADPGAHGWTRARARA